MFFNMVPLEEGAPLIVLSQGKVFFNYGASRGGCSFNCIVTREGCSLIWCLKGSGSFNFMVSLGTFSNRAGVRKLWPCPLGGPQTSSRGASSH